MNKKTNIASDLAKRIICYSIIIPVVILLLYFRLNPFVQILNLLFIALVAGVGVWEYAMLMHAKKLNPPKRLLILVGILEVFAIYAPPALGLWNQISVIVLLFSVVALCVFYFDKIQNALVNIATGFFGVCYVAIPLALMLKILYLPAQNGLWWLIYLVAVTKIADVGGYFIGKFFGKTQLTTKLSPNKTFEGAIMGLVCSIAMSIGLFFLAKSGGFDGFALTLTRAVWLGLLIGILAQVGDLAESLLKRDAKVKDSNRIPGIGGVLDVLDSLLFTAPFTYFFIQGF